MQQVRGAEEVFAGDGEEFRRVFRRVGINEGLCIRIPVQLAIEVVEGLLHGLGPVLDPHVGMQRRQAVGVAVEHVELVGQFVDHQVVAVPAAAGDDAVPGQDDRPLGPGFAAVFAIPFVLDAAGVAVALGAEEVVGVEDDFVEALVPVQSPQVHQRELGLGREQQALLLVQFDAGQGGQVLVMQEQHAGFAQPLVLGGADAVEEAQLMTHSLPGFIGNGVPGEGASATPSAQGPHDGSARCGVGTAGQAAADQADDHRQQRQKDDAHHQQRQVLLDEWDVAEEEAEGDQAADPQHGAEHAEAEEAHVGHFRHAGDEGGESADDRQEARQGHGLAAVLVVEVVGLLQVVAAEDLRVRVAEQALPRRAADEVIGAVAEDRRQHQQATQQPRVHAAARRHGAGDEQQRIPRQERRHHQAGFTEDHQEQDGVDPRPIVGHQHVEVHIEVQDEVEGVEIHAKHLCWWPGSAGFGSGFEMTTACVAFSYKPGRAALYGLEGEVRGEFVARDFGGVVAG